MERQSEDETRLIRDKGLKINHYDDDHDDDNNNNNKVKEKYATNITS